MQLKQEANTEPRKRFHLLARLRKAAKHSEKLEKLCESPRVDAKTKLEAQVSLWIQRGVYSRVSMGSSLSQRPVTVTLFLLPGI